MSWNPLKWFGSTKTVEKTADNLFDKDKGLLTQVGSWVGNMSFTDEEQAEYRVKVGDKVSDFVGKTLEENTERSKARRDIAVLWIKAQLSLVLMVAICLPFDKPLAKGYLELATIDVMLWGTGSIIAFFFGAYVWGAHIKRNKA